MPGIYIKNLSKELVDYIKELRGERTWAQWFMELQSDFRKKQDSIDELERDNKILDNENMALKIRLSRLQGDMDD